ncbi:apolipoprotein N-acyltransferase [Streptomyces sp. DSM 41524]|uniref:Apolipoprotein N-acyltransferase n=1 Tax=Streptomyces asiaticus subsp. ignotus TaxID=3098222 RepID=A0ABU7PX31_9ACTN|nr:apolipoprotein N-acyltransferase [Streptomyces sp. DSM 41524]
MPSGSDTTAEAAPTGPDADRPGQRTTGSAATPPREGADGAEGGDAVGGRDPVGGGDAAEGRKPVEGGDAVGGPDAVEDRDAAEGGESGATGAAAPGTAASGAASAASGAESAARGAAASGRASGTASAASGDAADASATASAASGSASASSAGGRRPGRLRRLGLLARREARRSALAAVSGLALGLAFPPFGVWPLSLVAVAALALLTHGRTARQGAWTGFAFGVPFFLLLLKWLSVVGWDAVVGLSIIEAAFLALMGAGLALVSRLPVPALWPLWTACLWVAEEWARDRVPFGGFPWGRLAFANTGSPYTPLAALGGAPLVTFGVALTGGALAGAALTLWRLRGAGGFSPRRALPAAGAVAVAAAVTAAGFAVPIPTAADDSVDIAVVQGNVQQPGMDFLGRPMMILDNHAKATLNLAKDIKAGRIAKPDLVIWPENASDLDPFQYREAYARIDEAVKSIGVPVLVGALVDHPTKQGYVENQGIVWDPKRGPGASYTKQHPVPFGEYVPFRQELSKIITRLQRVPRDFYPGDHTGVLNVGPARLGDVICFEVAYDEIVRDTVNAGARAIVVQTNNATYGRSGQPEQQLVMSRLRAIEHGRPVITAATSGISAVVSPDGTIEQRTKEFTQDVLTARIPLRDGKTLADRVGATPEWVLAMVGVLSCAAAIMIGRRGRTDKKGQ